MKEFYNILAEASKRYFEHLELFGYFKQSAVELIITVLLLIDSLDYFKDFITEEYFTKVKLILKNLECCNCAVEWKDFSKATRNSIAL